MKFTSFEIDGNYKYGSVRDGNILPASADFSQNYPDLKAARQAQHEINMFSTMARPTTPINRCVNTPVCFCLLYPPLFQKS